MKVWIFFSNFACYYFLFQKEMKNFLVTGLALAMAFAAAVSTSCVRNAKGNQECTECAECTSNVSSVLVVVDVQRDFFSPEGSLYVSGSEELPAKIAEVAKAYDAVIFTLDWHPGNHCSFAAEGGIWPSHCVAYTQGAGLADEFASILAGGDDKVQLFLKGKDQDKEQYGAFEDLAEGKIMSWLKSADKVAVCGIAGDYCVKESTANILKVVPASKVTILKDCIRSIDGGAALDQFIAENSLNVE